jgi:hypothetical protein
LGAGGDLRGGPAPALVSALALASLTLLVATSTLLTRAVADTGRTLVEAGPSLVVRRVDGSGWAPVPVADAARVAAVTGVIEVRPRIQGVATSASGPVTVIGVDEAARARYLAPRSLPAPGRGEVVVGPGVEPAPSLEIGGRGFAVVGRLDPASSMAAHDAALLSPADARAVLSIPRGHASDLAVEVFHPGEAAAVARDVARALPWPSRSVTRDEAAGAWQASVMRRGGLAALASLPAGLALALLVIGAGRHGLARRREIGILRAMGWSTADVTALQAARALLVGLPAAALGLAGAWFLVHTPGVTWPARLVLGWDAAPVHLTLQASQGLLLVAEIAAIVLAPWLVATLWPALRASSADPSELIEEGRA